MNGTDETKAALLRAARRALATIVDASEGLTEPRELDALASDVEALRSYLTARSDAAFARRAGSPKVAEREEQRADRARLALPSLARWFQ